MADDFKLANKPADASDSAIHRLFGDDLKSAEVIAAAMKRLEEIMHKPPAPEPTSVAELLFHTRKRRGMEFDRIPVGHDVGFRCYDGSKHDAESAFTSGEFGDGLTEDEAYADWLRNVDEPMPRASRMVGMGHPEQPPEAVDEPYQDPDDVDFDADLTDGEPR